MHQRPESYFFYGNYVRRNRKNPNYFPSVKTIGRLLKPAKHKKRNGNPARLFTSLRHTKIAAREYPAQRIQPQVLIVNCGNESAEKHGIIENN